MTDDKHYTDEIDKYGGGEDWDEDTKVTELIYGLDHRHQRTISPLITTVVSLTSTEKRTVNATSADTKAAVSPPTR